LGWGFGVYDLGCSVYLHQSEPQRLQTWFRVQGSESGVEGLELMVEGSGFSVEGLGLRVEVRVSGP